MRRWAPLLMLLVVALPAGAQQREEPATLDLDGTGSASDPYASAREAGRAVSLLEKLRQFPEDLAGAPVVLSQVRIGDLSRRGDVFIVTLRVAGLSETFYEYETETRFEMSKELARRWKAASSTGPDDTQRITAELHKGSVSGAHWAARIVRIEIVNAAGALVDDLRDPASR